MSHYDPILYRLSVIAQAKKLAEEVKADPKQPGAYGKLLAATALLDTLYG